MSIQSEYCTGKKKNGCSWARPMGWKIKYKIPDFTASEDLPLTKIQID